MRPETQKLHCAMLNGEIERRAGDLTQAETDFQRAIDRIEHWSGTDKNRSGVLAAAAAT